MLISLKLNYWKIIINNIITNNVMNILMNERILLESQSN